MPLEMGPDIYLPDAAEIFRRLEAVDPDEQLMAHIYPRVSDIADGETMGVRAFTQLFFEANFGHDAGDSRQEIYNRLIRNLARYVEAFTEDPESLSLARVIAASEFHSG